MDRTRPVSVLLVGFGPFPGAARNPTGPLVRTLARARAPALADVGKIAVVLPTTFAAVDRVLITEIEQRRPDVVLLFGLAARTPWIRLERQARNAVTQIAADARGCVACRPMIDPQRPSTVRTRAPMPRLLRAVRMRRLPVRFSRDAGRYICNLAYWRALTYGPPERDPPLVQFVHVPGVAPGAWRKRRGRRLSRADLVRAGEALLRELVAAARQAIATPGLPH